jgi:hypothetical protein
MTKYKRQLIFVLYVWNYTWVNYNRTFTDTISVRLEIATNHRLNTTEIIRHVGLGNLVTNIGYIIIPLLIEVKVIIISQID